jgi:hypothetical protein
VTKVASLTLTALSVLALGCNTNLTLDPEGVLCDAANLCPSGYECVSGACHRVSACAGGQCGTPTCSANSDCTSAPASACLDAATLRTYDPVGSCQENNSCAYSANDVTCAQGCANNACVGDPCAGINCNFAPAPTCLNVSTLRTYSAIGTCQNGVCGYPTTDVNCVNGCESGACTNQDLCAGVSCAQPPANGCVGGKIRTYEATGTCNSGTGQCSYNFAESNCAGICLNNQCVLGLAFTQTGPSIRHQVNAVDQAPGSSGNHVLAVGPGGRVAKWNGTRPSRQVERHQLVAALVRHHR